MDPEFLSHCLVLVPLAFAAGLIDAAVGGGGLIQVPALFTTFPQTIPAALLGTNKFSSIMGTMSASWCFTRHVKLDWHILLPSSVTAFIGAYAGAHSVNLLPVAWVRMMVIALLTVMIIYTIFRPDFGKFINHRKLTKRDLIAGLLIGAIIGFYDGFFGPGTGSFFIFLFIRFFHFDFIKASASTKIVNIATNLAALVFFIPAKLVLFTYAIPMAVANITGAQIGTRLAIKGGNLWIRRLFLVLASILLLKLIWDTV